LDSLTKWYGRKSTTELIACTRDRESWRNMKNEKREWMASKAVGGVTKKVWAN
jgi:hypothetical protein